MSKIHSVLFSNKWNEEDACEWLQRHNMKCNRLKLTRDGMRFQQSNKKKNLLYRYGPKISNGIQFLFEIPVRHITGGRLITKNEIATRIKQFS